MKISPEELIMRKNATLTDKIDMSTERIEQWYDHWKGLIYIAYSGGKDSSVLLHLVRSVFPEIPAVYNDTGLEYPEVKEHVKLTPNLVITKPVLTYRQVIEKYGFAVVSKEQSQFIYEYKNTHSEKLRDIRLNGNKSGLGKLAKKWKFLLEAPFKISHKCCEVLKKNPAKVYERKSGRKVLLGSTIEESIMRQQQYIMNGCNAYKFKRPTSIPLAFWNKQNILQYLIDKNISLPSVYGSIEKNDKDEWYTTGVDRTGCVWCLFGIDREEKDGLNRMQRLKMTHPKIWNYCINNLGLGDVLDFIDVDYE